MFCIEPRTIITEPVGGQLFNSEPLGDLIDLIVISEPLSELRTIVRENDSIIINLRTDV